MIVRYLSTRENNFVFPLVKQKSTFKGIYENSLHGSIKQLVFGAAKSQVESIFQVTCATNYYSFWADHTFRTMFLFRSFQFLQRMDTLSNNVNLKLMLWTWIILLIWHLRQDGIICNIAPETMIALLDGFLQFRNRLQISYLGCKNGNQVTFQTESNSMFV